MLSFAELIFRIANAALLFNILILLILVILNNDNILVQRLIPLQRTAEAKRNRGPNQRKLTLILGPRRVTVAQSRRKSPANAANHIPHAHMPSNLIRLRRIPIRLRFEDVQQRRQPEKNAAQQVREVVCALLCGLAEVLQDAGQREDAADVKDGGANGHGEGGQEANLVYVVRSHVFPRRPPLPFALRKGMVRIEVAAGARSGRRLLDGTVNVV